MKNIYLSAAFLSIFFIFNAFFQYHGEPKLYIIYLIILPFIEEIVKFNIFKFNQFSFKHCGYLVAIFVVFETIYKLIVIREPFFGLQNGIFIQYFIILSPGLLHIALMLNYFKNFEFCIDSNKIIFSNIFFHYMYNGLRNIIDYNYYYYFFVDSFLLLIYIYFRIFSWRKHLNFR
jgi:hypothetical protein